MDEVKSLHDRVVDVLKTCYDPEIPVNIYDLGLIYEVLVSDGNDIHVRMTLTSPARPVARDGHGRGGDRRHRLHHGQVVEKALRPVQI